jgi:hypothetical protein
VLANPESLTQPHHQYDVHPSSLPAQSCFLPFLLWPGVGVKMPLINVCSLISIHSLLPGDPALQQEWLGGKVLGVIKEGLLAEMVIGPSPNYLTLFFFYFYFIHMCLTLFFLLFLGGTRVLN